MGLDIGGAETHVVELSRALKKLGNEVVVASNGGVYEKELADCGIEHVKLPLHSKRPDAVIKSYFGLKKYIKESGGFDIVHGHARIPSFICGILSKKLNFRFTTSAHWVFKVTPLWRLMANWGEKTVAVSDDIKQYLIDNYNFYPDNIKVTINGIDVDKFSKNIDVCDIKEEFGLKDGAFRIIYVSRMDVDRSAVAFMLAKITPKLLKLRENLEVVIVGGGNDYDRLVKETDAINTEIGKKVIKVTGARTDINKFIAAGDVFVGVSRAALEAMSAGLPVIIAGNEGYIGTFDESKFKISYDTNFCCRSCPESDCDKLYADLEKLLCAPAETLEKMGEYNRETVIRHYSAERMAKDYLEVFRTMTPNCWYKSGEVIISGYYGFKNVGDDALLQKIIENIKALRPDTKITVLSRNPRETRRLYQIRSINRFNILGIAKEMRHAKLLISGGGSLLQDKTSARSFFYYSYIIKAAKKRGLKTMLYANGIGPIETEKNRKRAKEILESMDYISLREGSSADTVKELGAKVTPNITCDPAFFLESADEKWISRLIKRYDISPDKKYFAIALRDWQENDKRLDEKISDLCRRLGKEKLCPIFIAMQDSKDYDISKRICAISGKSSPIIVNATARELVGLLSHVEFVVGMRLHTLIFAAAAGIPMVGLSYDPKVDSVLEYIGMPYTVDVSDIDTDKLEKLCLYVLENKDALCAALKEQLEKIGALSQIDARRAVELLESKN